jgi:hypothetical protein
MDWRKLLQEKTGGILGNEPKPQPEYPVADKMWELVKAVSQVTRPPTVEAARQMDQNSLGLIDIPGGSSLATSPITKKLGRGVAELSENVLTKGGKNLNLFQSEESLMQLEKALNLPEGKFSSNWDFATGLDSDGAKKLFESLPTEEQTRILKEMSDFDYIAKPGIDPVDSKVPRLPPSPEETAAKIEALKRLKK